MERTWSVEITFAFLVVVVVVVVVMLNSCFDQSTGLIGILQTILPGLLDILVPYTPTSPDPGSSSPASTSSSTSTSSTPNLERQSYTVWPDLTQLITKPTRSNPLSVHVLPRTASDEVLRRITSGLVGSDTPVEEITVDLVDGLVRGELDGR
jgi:predicted PurR-regulated permease PerM